MDKEELRILHKIQKTCSLDDLIMIRNNFSYEIAKRVESRNIKPYTSFKKKKSNWTKGKMVRYSKPNKKLSRYDLEHICYIMQIYYINEY